MKILETNRLKLSELTTADAPFILELVNTPDWLQFIGDRGVKNIQDAENYIIHGPMASYAGFGHGLYLVTLNDTAAPIGICGIIKRDMLEDRDLGFALLPLYTGKGYAYEAASATLQYANQILGIQRIVAITLATNSRSVRLLTKLGLLYEKMIRFPDSTQELMLFANR